MAKLNAEGKYAGDFVPFAICGYVREKGEADMALTE